MFLKVILLSILIISCKSAPTKQVIQPTPSVTPIVTEYTKVNIVKLTGFTTAQAARFIRVAAEVQKIINSEEFKQKVLNFSQKSVSQYFDTLDSNQTVLYKLLQSPWKLEYRLEYLSANSDVIGYTYPSVTWVALNRKKYPGLKDSEIARNICHEWLHKIGYKHTMKYTSNRPNSVPYGVAEIAFKLYPN